MTGLPTIVQVEIMKLRRSLVILLAVAAPVFVALISLLGALHADKPQPWKMIILSGSAMWGYFMLPMASTALTILIAQIEHAPGAWSAVLSLPAPRWRVFAAKAIVAVMLIGVMSAVLLILLFLDGFIVEAVKPRAFLIGSPDALGGAKLMATMFAGSLLLIAVQLWAALRFRSFMPPLILGIGGTFVAVVATASKAGVWFPWLIAVQALGTDPSRSGPAIAFGFLGGIAAMVAMLVHMSRHEPQ